MAIKQTIKVGTISFTAGTKQSIELPRNGVALEYRLRVRYTITNGSSAAEDPFYQALGRIVRRLDVILGGRDTVVSLFGEQLMSRATVEFGAVPDGMADTVVLTGSATATAYDVLYTIPRFLPRSRNPLQTADDLRRVRSATLEVTWADNTLAWLYGTPNSPAGISLVTADLEVDYLVDAGPEYQPMVRQLTHIDQVYSAASQALSITIDGQTGLALRSIDVISLDDSVGSNALINKLKVAAGPVVFSEQDGPAIQAMNKLRYGLESIITGYHFIPFTFLGDDSLAILSSPQALPSDVQAVFDVTTGSGTEELLLSVEAIRPPRVV
jgi:hypothetical protein